MRVTKTKKLKGNRRARKILFGRVRLRLVIRFLSIDFDTVNLEDLDSYDPLRELLRVARFRMGPTGRGFEVGVERLNWRKKAKEVQGEVERDLFGILAAESTEESSRQASQRNELVAIGLSYGRLAQREVSHLVQKLERVESRGRYVVSWTESARGKPPGPVLTLKDRPLPPPWAEFYFKDRGSLICAGRAYSLSCAPSYSLRDQVYWHLARTIEERCLEDLGICSQCEKLYVREKTKQKFCSEKCKTTFHNQRRLTEGYFTDCRKKRRANAIAKARRLLRQGRSILAVEEETGLSRKVLKKNGLLP